MYDVRMKRHAERIIGTILAFSLAFASGCETNPYTGRSQLLMTSVSQEMQLGAQAYNQVKNDPKIKPSQDSREIEPVKRVAARIVEAAKRSKYAEMAQQFQWEVTVIRDDKTANAFALPGGKMAVYTGIFPMAKTEAGLAAVMGHEVVHALARHGAERMSQGQLTSAALQVAGAAAGASGMNPLLSQGTMAALGVASVQSQARIGSRLYRHSARGRRRLRPTRIGGSVGTDGPNVRRWRASGVHVHPSE
jgi:predicted Zn-dependent protease